MLRRLSRLLGRRRFDADLDTELRFHLDMRARALEDEGWMPAAARRQAQLEFGGATQVREASRDVWIAHGLDTLWQDVRFAARTLRRTPTFTFTIVLTLALGIGANTAIFTVLDAVVLRPLAYAAPDRLVLLWGTSPAQPLQPLTPGNFYDFHSRLSSIEGLSGVSQASVTLSGDRPAERHSAMSVSSSFFRTLGVHAALGRVFAPEDGPGRRELVLSDRLWRSRFDADASVIGRAVSVNGQPYVIAGVMDAGFVMPFLTPQPARAGGPELWTPADQYEIPRTPMQIDEDVRANRRAGYLRAVGRLRAGVNLAAAQAEVTTLAAQMARDYPADNAQIGARLEPFSDHLVGGARQPVTVLFLGVLAVLAIACANIASLLVARTAARRGEVAVRLALGATRPRIVRQLLTESLLIGAVAGAFGLGVGDLLRRLLIAFGPSLFPRLHFAAVNGRALIFAVIIALMTAVMFGLLPALQASRTRARVSLPGRFRGADDTPGRLRWRRLLVAGEIALTCALLTAAVLLGRSLWSLVHVAPGYDPRQVLTFELFLSGPRAEYQSRQVALYDGLLDRLRVTPGVSAAAAIVNLPVGGDDFGTKITPEGAPPVAPGSETRINFQVASAGYFDAMRIGLREGRDFDRRDTRDAAPVVIVNEALVRHYWSQGGAVGRRVRIGPADRPWATIVGVVSDVHHGGFAAPVRPELYEPYTQVSFPFMSFVVRTTGDPMTLAPAVRRFVAELDSAVPVSGVSTLEDGLGQSIADTRFLTWLLVGFASVAVLVAAVGVFGLIALGVAERRPELAIRLALGASRGQVIGLVLRQATAVGAVGLVAGLALSLVASRGVRSLLFGVSPHDVITLAMAPALLALVAAAAALVPAWRAARIAPFSALHSD